MNWLQCQENTGDPTHSAWAHGHLFQYVLEKQGRLAERAASSDHTLHTRLKTGVGTDDDIRAAFRYFRHPRVNGADRAAAAMYCINGPRSPEKYKREVAWSYSRVFSRAI